MNIKLAFGAAALAVALAACGGGETEEAAAPVAPVEEEMAPAAEPMAEPGMEGMEADGMIEGEAPVVEEAPTE